MKAVVPRFQGVDDGEEFLVVDIVVAFGGGEQLREVGTGVPIPVGISL